MTNLQQTPNRLLMSSGFSFTAHFGCPYAAVPLRHVAGLGHDTEHIKVHFVGGLSLELTRASAIELARRLPEALAFPATPADCSGACVDVGGEGA